MSRQSDIARFGRFVRRLRRERDLSQEALAHHAGLHPNTITTLETGAENVQLRTAFAVARGFGMTPGELFVAFDQFAAK